MARLLMVNLLYISLVINNPVTVLYVCVFLQEETGKLLQINKQGK